MSSTATTNDPNVALNIEEIVGLMPLPGILRGMERRI